MSKKEKEVIKEVDLPAHYFRLVRSERNLYSVETILVENGKVTDSEKTEPAYLPIAFDKLRRKTGESFFAAVQEESK